ncbi:hypothetical protein GYMLUDRAFT_40771 [Collybiopsis luxurians FD-317 M1]|uniref:BTB domain-containing protein n=1 Tax=Collybiopsis luxurians FD-317 M1 TaxID=944289 RepID=A0A0D0C6D9_9AGAR|nr:hypothetical protein GYMLUDRAFT_40771 [Collybiopsis luxurians FD-317 M1]
MVTASLPQPTASQINGVEPTTPTAENSLPSVLNDVMEKANPFTEVQTASYPRDNSFYHDHRVFLVDGVLFRFQINILAAESEHWSAMMDLPMEPSSKEGLDDQHPIHIDGVLKEDFRQLLRVLSPPQRFMEPVPKLTFSEWTSVLKLADMWCMDKVKNHAISTMNGLPNIDPVDKVVIARKFDIRSWLTPSFNEILRRPQSFTKTDLERLGDTTFFLLLQFRERLRPYNTYYGGWGNIDWRLDGGRETMNFDFTQLIEKELPDYQVAPPLDESDPDSPELSNGKRTKKKIVRRV